VRASLLCPDHTWRSETGAGGWAREKPPGVSGWGFALPGWRSLHFGVQVLIKSVRRGVLLIPWLPKQAEGGCQER
jgi:hypothetical protein